MLALFLKRILESKQTPRTISSLLNSSCWPQRVGLPLYFPQRVRLLKKPISRTTDWKILLSEAVSGLRNCDEIECRFPGWGPDPNWLLIRPSRAHTRVFPDRNYRVFSEFRAHYGLIMVWRWSDQRSLWSGKSDHRRIRAHLGLIRGNFERNWVWS